MNPTPKLGCLYGLSLGPGDPGLITTAAMKKLKQKSIWTYPVRKPGAESYALQIALAAGLALPEQHRPLVFPMTHDLARLEQAWQRAAKQVLSDLQTGQDVCFLVEGDSSTYSTFSYLKKALIHLEPKVRCETLAGVPSYNAAAARLSVSLVDTDDKMAILPAGYGMKAIEEAIDQFDTLVLLKVKPLIEPIIDLLSTKDLLDTSWFIEKAGSRQERIVEHLTDLRGQKVNYLSLILVRNLNRTKAPVIRGCKPKQKEAL